MYPVSNYEEVFSVTEDYINQIYRLLSGFLTKKNIKCTQRDAFKKALQAIDQLSKDKTDQIFKKLEGLTTKEVSVYNSKDLNKELASIYESKEFDEFKKIMSCIPENQRNKFLYELLLKIDNSLFSIRNYLLNHDFDDQTKITVLDQAVYQLFLLNSNLKEELGKSKIVNNERINELVTYFTILMIKITGFIRNQITEEQVYEIISIVDEKLKIKNKEEVRELLFALTN